MSEQSLDNPLGAIRGMSFCRGPRVIYDDVDIVIPRGKITQHAVDRTPLQVFQVRLPFQAALLDMPQRPFTFGLIYNTLPGQPIGFF